MSGKVIETAKDSVTLGPVSIPTSELLAMPVESFARNGVVLHNVRVKANIVNADKLPVGYTLSIYIQRDPLTDAERDAVNVAKTEGDTKKAQRADAERLDRERAVKGAFELGQSATMGALRNIGDLAAGARALAAIK